MLAGTQKPMLGTKLNRAHPLAKGLVGCWLFNEGVGNIAYDSSGYGNHGTLTNMAFPPTAVSGWNPSKDGIGLNFDGADDYINCGNDSSLDITDAITIEAWVKLDIGFVGYGMVVGKSTNKDYDVGIYVGTDIGEIRFHSGDGTQEYFTTSGAGIILGNWYHIVTVRTVSPNNEAKFYVNSVYLNTQSYARTPTGSTDNVLIGMRSNQSYPFNGSIDGVKIYNRALSAKEIKSLYRKQYAMFERGELLL